jgi:glycosyltransferase involved in cell wall biosynthesis
MSGLKSKVAVIVPVLNEEQNVPILTDRLLRTFASEPEDVEIVFVDDGSTDGTVEWIRQQAVREPRLKLVRLSRTFGHQIAITAGLDFAAADAVVIMDGDLQDPPEVIPELLKKWRAGYEVVYAVRASRRGENWLKRALAAAFYRFFRRLIDIDVPRDAGDFRLLDRQPLEALRNIRELHRFVRGLTCWVGFRQTAVTYDRDPRLAGRTKYPMFKSAKLALDAVTSFSGAPLRWVVAIGLAVSVLGAFEAARIIVGRIVSPEKLQPGWASLTALVLILGGVQLVCIGLVGQYVSRIFEEAKKRPLYFVRETIGEFRTTRADALVSAGSMHG